MSGYGALSASAAQPCPLGTFASTPGSERCTACVAGSFANTTRSTSCFSCAPGTALSATGAASSGDCSPCERGAYSSWGAARCSLCVGGTYAPDEGTAECVRCPAGTAHYLLGSVSPADCAPCPPGKHAVEPGSKVCKPCAAGNYTNATATALCEQCALVREQTNKRMRAMPHDRTMPCLTARCGGAGHGVQQDGLHHGGELRAVRAGHVRAAAGRARVRRLPCWQFLPAHRLQRGHAVPGWLLRCAYRP
jgi:hypothetical protein